MVEVGVGVGVAGYSRLQSKVGGEEGLGRLGLSDRSTWSR